MEPWVLSNPSTEPSMKSDRTHSHASSRVASLLAFVVACHAGGAVAQSPKKVPSGDPCTVVPLADVQKAFSGAKPGARSSRLEKEGLTECEWKDGGGVVVFVVQEFYGSDTAMQEAQGMAFGFVDGSKPGAAGSLRYETLTAVGLGNEAVAFVEARDDKRGIRSGGAMLALHRGGRTLFLTSPVLQARDRATALKTLEVLGRIAAKRLD